MELVLPASQSSCESYVKVSGVKGFTEPMAHGIFLQILAISIKWWREGRRGRGRSTNWSKFPGDRLSSIRGKLSHRWMPSDNERVHRSHPRFPVWAEQALGVPQPMFFTHKAWSEVEAMPFSYLGVGIWEAEGATKWAVVTWERTNTKFRKTMQIHHQINGSWMKREIPEGGQEQSQQGRGRKAESGVIPYFKETAAGICVCTHTHVHVGTHVHMRPSMQ